VRGRSPRRARAAWVAALVLCAACAGPGRPEQAPVTEPERRAYEAARSLEVSDPGSAERQLEEFIRSWPDSALVPNAAIRLGNLARARDDDDAALRWFRRTVREQPRGSRADVARLRIAEIEFERGRLEEATQTLGQVRLARLDQADQRSAYRVLASAAPDPVAKLRWLARLRVSEPDEDAVSFIDVEIDDLIAGLDAPNVDRAIQQIGREIPIVRLLLRRANLALDDGDIDAAEKAWKRAAKLPRAAGTDRAWRQTGERIELARAGHGAPLELPSFAEVAQRPMPPTAKAGGALGVVLPLSGSFSRFGEESLEGILLAAGVFDELLDNRARANVRLVIRDSAGRPERAAEAVRELAEDETVSAIIGPLLKGECEAAAAAAESVAVPLIAITARAEVAQGRPQVFRVRTQPSQEIEALVNYVTQEAGATRFAILYPRDAYGRGLRALFWDAVEARGGHIVGIASYEPDVTDFAEPIRRLVGFDLLDSSQKRALGDREDMLRRARRLPPDEAITLREEARALTTEDGEPLPPIVDFDALFIPESYEKVVLIAPQLAFHEVVGARLLGTSGWNDPELVRIAQHHVEGALFTSQYYADSPVPFVKDFGERFRATFDEEPAALAAQAYDAANLAIVQLARGRVSREELREGVLAIRAYPGVSGVLRMSADGNAHKRPFLLGVEHGHVTQID